MQLDWSTRLGVSDCIDYDFRGRLYLELSVKSRELPNHRAVFRVLRRSADHNSLEQSTLCRSRLWRVHGLIRDVVEKGSSDLNLNTHGVLG